LNDRPIDQAVQEQFFSELDTCGLHRTVAYTQPCAPFRDGEHLYW
jgi:hypothetical protein